MSLLMTNNPPLRKIFICTNGNCASSQSADEIYQQLLIYIRDYGLDNYDAPYRVKATTCGCLDVCNFGPVMVIQPDQVIYRHIDHEVLTLIFQQHILNNRVVTEYVVTPKET
jgi:(2Fe-2S) ferredoxin